METIHVVPEIAEGFLTLVEAVAPTAGCVESVIMRHLP
jgi:hypothetical protein